MVVGLKDVVVKINGTGLPVGSLNISNDAKIDPRRTINQNNSFYHNGPLNGSVTLEGALTTGWLPLINQTGESTGFSLNIGGASFTGVHLQQLKIKAEAFSPVMVTAELKYWAAPSGLISGSSGEVGASTIAHASQSTFSIGGVEFPYEFNYVLQLERVPRFSFGSIAPEKVLLARVEKELNIQGANLTGIMNYSGDYAAANINLNGIYNISLSGNINQQNFSLSDLGEASISLKEFVR